VRIVVVGRAHASMESAIGVRNHFLTFPKTNGSQGRSSNMDMGFVRRKRGELRFAIPRTVCALDWETNAETGTELAHMILARERRARLVRTQARATWRKAAPVAAALKEIAGKDAGGEKFGCHS